MAKKINVGTNYLITNCGWDMKKFQELIWYRDGRGFKTPIVANLLLPTLGWAKGIHSGRLPGVHLSDDLFHKILEDYDEGKSVAREKSFHRLAVMIVGIKLMGYAGVQLSGVDDYETLTEVIELADNIEKSISSKQEWNELWENSNRLKSGKIANSSPNPSGIYLFNSENKPEFGSIESFPSINSVTASEDEIKKFNFMNGIHNHLFKDGSIGASIFKPISKVFDSNNFSRKVFLNIEHATKNKTLGCESCGYCRIDHLMYICPETCPKGLANGPCSGTDDNVCEFKDRECIHNRKYRIAKEVGKLSSLELTFIPAVKNTRGTSSWINQFSDDHPISTTLISKAETPKK